MLLPNCPDSDDVAPSDDSLRFLIRDELCKGFSGFKWELQEALRNTLRDELPRAVAQCSTPDAKRFSSLRAGLPHSMSLDTLPSPNNQRSQSKDNIQEFASEVDSEARSPVTRRPSGRRTSVPSSFESVLPGSTSIVSIASNPQVACTKCDNVFLCDALFCRKCGEKRPGVCECGNILQPDAKFCRKCGKACQHESEASYAASEDPGPQPTILARCTSESKNKTKKKKVPNAKKMLFRVSTDEQDEVSLLQRITTHKLFELVSGSVIVANAIFLGWQTQHIAAMHMDSASRDQPLEEPPGIFFAFSCIFCVYFLVELALRWMSDGLVEFFRTDELYWNLFDIAIVFTGTLEICLGLVAEASGTQKNEALQNVSVIRMLRIVRIVRVARVIRVMKVFRELRMMIYSIFGSVMNLVWVMVVLFLTFYLFGVSFTAATSDFLDTTEKWNNHDYDDLSQSFGTVDKSVISLFMAMSGGNDWAMYYEALVPLSWYYPASFLLFILFAMFAVVNIVTGVFVESALQANLKDKDIVVQEEIQAKRKYLISMREIFEEMDEDGKGTISQREFEAKLQDERVIMYFHALKLDVSDAATLFQLLDYDNSDEVGIDEFLEGCYKLQGESTSMDMKIMQYEVQHLQESFKDFHRLLEEVHNVSQVQQHAVGGGMLTTTSSKYSSEANADRASDRAKTKDSSPSMAKTVSMARSPTK